MSNRPPVPVLGLTVGDYLLWNWSLNGNHDVIALIAGLTLPPLIVASVWVTALMLARLLSRTARARSDRSTRAAASAMVEAAPASTEPEPRKLAA